MKRLRIASSLAALAVLVLAMVWLSWLEKAGPPHLDLTLEGDIPATLYLPNPGPNPGPDRGPESGPDREKDAEADPIEPLSPALRPPAVILAHGFSEDRAAMSGLARAISRAGYAALTLDFRGHGGNRNPFTPGWGRADFLYSDLTRAVDFLRSSPRVDGARIVVMGHSMGAGASLDYGTRDTGIDGVVMISGGWHMMGPYRPPNALFIYGQADPPSIRERSQRLAARLADRPWAEPGVVYGEFDRGRAVSQVEVPRADHITILFSTTAARQIIAWLDRIYEVERGPFFVPGDPRLRPALLGLLALILVLPGLGEVVGRLAPRLAERPGRGLVVNVGWLALALAATLPLLAGGAPGSLVSLEVADFVTTQLLLAGGLLLVSLTLAGRLQPSELLRDWPATVSAAIVGCVAVYFLLTPFGVVMHGLGLTPERALQAIWVLVLLLPFTLAFQFLLRRGGTLVSTLASSLGRVAILALLVASVRLGIAPFVVLLMLPPVAGLFVLLEVLGASIYASSRNWMVVALLEALWLAWIFAAVLPVGV